MTQTKGPTMSQMVYGQPHSFTSREEALATVAKSRVWVTPSREYWVHVLIGEGLVEIRGGYAYYVPPLIRF